MRGRWDFEKRGESANSNGLKSPSRKLDTLGYRQARSGTELLRDLLEMSAVASAMQHTL